MGFPHGFKARANRIAVRIREQLGLSSTDPIDPTEICKIFDIEVIGLSEVAPEACPFLGDDQSSFSAVTVPCGLRTAIVHNDTHNSYRQRSNVCHELAHCFLGHRFTPPLTESGERARDSGVEAEANFLAGCLLITNEAALYIVRQGLQRQAQGIYGVSKPMLDYRMRLSGAMVVHSRLIAGRSW